MHMVANVWHAIVKQGHIWIPALDWVHAGKYPDIYRVYNKPESYVYLVHLYTAVLMLGGNEIGPRTYIELVSSTIILIGLAIFNASLFGELAILSEVS